jgi:uncharacterized membrane protein
MMREFNEIIPDAANRILTMAESQTYHRHKLEKMAAWHQIGRSWGGLICGFVIACGTIGAGTYLVYLGHGWYGALIATASLASLVSVFVIGGARQQSQMATKKGQLQRRGRR